jgi:hypothetical protein
MTLKLLPKKRLLINELFVLTVVPKSSSSPVDIIITLGIIYILSGAETPRSFNPFLIVILTASQSAKFV